MMSLTRPLWLSLLVVYAMVLILAKADAKNGKCITYETELKSRPDLTHRVVYKSNPLPPSYIITSMELDAQRQRSFYWCELKLPDRDQVKTYRHFGHNTTHLWVEKGCGAWFIVTACHKPSAADTSSNSDTESPTDSSTSPPSTTTTVHQEQRKQLELSDLRHGALLSLISWLSDKSQSVEDKLGAHPNGRVLRSVDEEFASEFGI